MKIRFLPFLYRPNRLVAFAAIFLAFTAVDLNAQSGPVISSLDPSAAALGSTSLMLTVNGSNFSVGSVVRWNGSNRFTTRVNSSTLTTTISTDDLAGLATAEITVAFGQSISNVVPFTIYRAITLPTKDLIYDGFGGRIYASVPGTTPTGNSIVSVDPYTGALGTPVFMGSEPGKLALSENGQYLYASLDGAAAVRRMDLVSQTAVLQFHLGSDPFSGPNYVSDIEVLPGNPSAVAVSLKYFSATAPNGAVAIYDDGVKRPVEVPRYSGANKIEFSSSASTLYGYDCDFGDRFRTMSVNAAGGDGNKHHEFPIRWLGYQVRQWAGLFELRSRH
jgi:hypothetical protein